ncbi:PAS domain-containing protein [Azospirillum sp. sgz302134]
MDTESVDWASVFAASPAPTVVVGGTGRVRAANAAFAALVGVEPDALSGVPLDEVLALDDPEVPSEGMAFLRQGDGETRCVPVARASLSDGGRVVTLTDTNSEHCVVCKVYSSREKFRTAIDDQSELICRFRPDLTVTLVNRAFAALFDSGPRAMIDRNLGDLLPAATAAAIRDFLASVTPESPASAQEELWPHADGTERWISWRRYALFDAQGRITAVQSVGRDTTLRHRAEQERARLAAMVGRSPVVGLAWRSEGNYPIEYATDNLGRLGIGRAKLLEEQAGLLDLLHPDDVPAIIGWTGACPEGGAPLPLTVRLRADDGGERWLSISAWRTEGGTVEAVVMDVSDQRAATLALRERERRFKAIFDHTFEFIGLLTPEGRMIEANETALSFIGAPEDAVYGRFFWDTPWWRHSPADQQRLKDGVARAARGEFVRFETSHSAPDGRQIMVDFSLRPILDEDGTVIFLVPEGRDITDLKETEAALRAAKREAEAANRSKTQFLAVMSHELRTPLNAVLGYSEVMQVGLFGPIGNDRYKGYVDAIHTSGRHLLEIIDDILEISRIELGVVDLNEEPALVPDIVARAAQILANRAGEAGVSLQVEVEPNLPPLRCDARRVIQALVNVGVNGIKFTPRGGLVRMEAERDGEGDFLFIVRDTGVGIAPEDQPKVWDPFVQSGDALVRRSGGVGLGLAITRALVEAHGGTAGLESAPGQGTVVALRFPAERGGDSARAIAPQTAQL